MLFYYSFQLNDDVDISIYSQTSVARTPLDREKILETEVVRANEC